MLLIVLKAIEQEAQRCVHLCVCLCVFMLY